MAGGNARPEVLTDTCECPRNASAVEGLVIGDGGVELEMTPHVRLTFFSGAKPANDNYKCRPARRVCGYKGIIRPVCGDVAERLLAACSNA